MPPPVGGGRGPSDDLTDGAPRVGTPTDGVCFDDARSVVVASPLRGAGALRALRDCLSAGVGAAVDGAVTVGAAAAPAAAEDAGAGRPPLPAPARSTALTRPIAALAWRSQPPRCLGFIDSVDDAGGGDGARAVFVRLADTAAASCCGSGAARRAGDVRMKFGGVCGSGGAATTVLAC